MRCAPKSQPTLQQGAILGRKMFEKKCLSVFARIFLILFKILQDVLTSYKDCHVFTGISGLHDRKIYIFLEIVCVFRIFTNSPSLLYDMDVMAHYSFCGVFFSDDEEVTLVVWVDLWIKTISLFALLRFHCSLHCGP